VRHGITTKGGTEFPKDIECLVTHVYRGELTLKTRNPDPMNIFGSKFIMVRCVKTWDVELLPDTRPRCNDPKCLHLTKEHRTGMGCRKCRCGWYPGCEKSVEQEEMPEPEPETEEKPDPECNAEDDPVC
jgi:hypothetical protein